jgi:hypothetical protein
MSRRKRVFCWSFGVKTKVLYFGLSLILKPLDFLLRINNDMFNLKTILTVAATTSTLLGVAMVKPSLAGQHKSHSAAVSYEVTDNESYSYSKSRTVKYVGYDKKEKNKGHDYDNDDKYDRNDDHKDYGKKDNGDDHNYRNVDNDRSEWKPKNKWAPKPKCPPKVHHRYRHNSH